MNTLKNHLVAPLAVALSLSLAVSTQDRSHVRRDAPAMDPTTISAKAVGLDVVDGTLVAVGPGYKARLRARGVEFVPALGDVPQTHNLEFRFVHARRGNDILCAAASGASSPATHDGLTASYDRNGMVETYRVRQDGLKQSFVFAQRPGGAGDLVVRGEVATTFEWPAQGKYDGAVSFTAPGGDVTIGKVVGIDADGREVRGHTVVSDGGIEFVLPAQFVDEAKYPLVLDPPISGSSIISGADALHPDVAYDASLDVYLVVWEERFSSFDIDVRAQRVLSDGSLTGLLQAVTQASGVERNPAVANCNAENGFCVVWQQAPSAVGPWDVYGRMVPAPNASSPASFAIANSTTQNEVRPDIAGDATLTSDRYVVVWQDGGTIIRARYVDASSQILGSVRLLASATEVANPAISKSGGTAGRLMVVWEQLSASGRDIRSALITNTASPLDSSYYVTTDTHVDLEPDVDGDGTNFTVAWHRRAVNATTLLHDVYCRGVAWDGSALVPTSGHVAVGNQASADERNATVGFMGTKFLVGFAKEATNPGMFSARLVDLAPVSCTSCGSSVTILSAFVFLEPRIAIGPQFHGDGSASATEAMVAYQKPSASPPFPSDVLTLRYSAYDPDIITNLGGGCGNGGTHDYNGAVAVGNTELALQVNGAGSDWLLASILFADSSIVCGPCVLQTTNFFFVLGSGGSGSFPLPVPCNPALAGTEVWSQWVSLFTGVNACALVPASLEASFSNRLHAVVTY